MKGLVARPILTAVCVLTSLAQADTGGSEKSAPAKWGGRSTANMVSDATGLPADLSAVVHVELPIRSRKGRPKLLGYFTPGVIDLSGLHYDPRTGHVFVISDSTNTILEYSREQTLLNAYAFPGDNQEGITVDDAGYIYVAQDSGGVIKFKWLRGD